MKEKALQYYKQGYNCSQCLLKAAENKYHIPMTKQNVKMFTGINTGFGIGGMCSVLIAGVSIFGIMFDEPTTKRLRMKLFDAFQSKYNSLQCGQLLSYREQNGFCMKVIGDAAEMVDIIIQEEKANC